MAQGNITQILSSKPEDRRMIFEEAAGITKYKAQKKEALRKLEYTEQNLLRVADLVREVKRQIGSLQRQAGKARRYKQLSARTAAPGHPARAPPVRPSPGRDCRSARPRPKNLRNEIETASASVLRSEDEIAQLAPAALPTWNTQISGMQQRGLELKGEVDRHESRIHFNEERLREFAAQNTKATADLTQAEERRRAAEEEIAAVTERLAAVRGRARTITARPWRPGRMPCARLEEELRAAAGEAAPGPGRRLRCRAGPQPCCATKSPPWTCRSRATSSAWRSFPRRKSSSRRSAARLEARLQEFVANVEAEKLNAQTQRGTVEERQQRLREIQQELNRAAAGRWTRSCSSRPKRDRASTCSNSCRPEHEGFGAGALAALKQSQHVLGSLADKIRVPDPYVTAIETALGHHLQLVLTEQPESARQILADLGANKKGRASIAPHRRSSVRPSPTVRAGQHVRAAGAVRRP